MTSIKNDRPATAPRTTSTTGPAPTPDQSMVDDLDGVEDVEAIEGMGLANGTSFAHDTPSSRTIRSTTVTLPKPLSLDEPGPGPAPLDKAAVSSLAESVLGTLKPGEKIVVGGKAEASLELAIGVEVGIEVERRADGKFEVKLEQSGFAGVGGKVGLGSKEMESKGGLVGASGVTFVVDTFDQAAAIVGEATAAAAVGQLFVPGSGPVAAGAAAMALNSGSISELHVGLGAGVVLEMDIVDQLKAASGGEVSMGIVYAPPGEAFLELKSKGELAGEASVGGEDSALASSGGAEAEITVRVPLGAVASAKALADPETQRALLAKAGSSPAGTTMSYERTLTASTVVGAVETTVVKEVEGNRLDKLFADGGWHVRTSALVGPTLGGTIGPLTVEVVMQKSATLYEAPASSPADAAKQVQAHATEIAKKEKQAHE